MRNKLTSALAAIAVITVSTFGLQQEAHAGASKEESIGVGSGAVVGALAGGPVGFIIGAAIGAKIGDSYHKKNESIDELEINLDGSNARVAALSGEVDTLSDEVSRLQNVARPELVALMQAGIDMDLLFRTDEYALTDATGDRLHKMATTIAAMPEVNIQLDGFADERGAADYNQALSEKRVEFVRDLFIAAGVHPTRIHSSAHGEAIAQDATTDSYALERRVSVKLFIDNGTSVAASVK